MSSDSYGPAAATRQKTLFYAIGAVLLVVSLAGMYLSLFISSPAWDSSMRQVCLVMSSLLMLAATLVVVWPAVVEWRLSAVVDLPQTLSEVSASLADLEAVRREHFRARASIEQASVAFVQQTNAYAQELERLKGELRGIRELDAELRALRQEKGVLDDTIAAWYGVAVDICEQMDVMLSHEDILPETREALNQLAEGLFRTLQRMNFAVIRPAVGLPFDKHLHEKVAEECDAEIAAQSVIRCTKWGYQYPGRVEKAKVLVSRGAPPSQEDEPCLPDSVDQQAIGSSSEAASECDITMVDVSDADPQDADASDSRVSDSGMLESDASCLSESDIQTSECQTQSAGDNDNGDTESSQDDSELKAVQDECAPSAEGN